MVNDSATVALLLFSAVECSHSMKFCTEASLYTKKSPSSPSHSFPATLDNTPYLFLRDTMAMHVKHHCGLFLTM